MSSHSRSKVIATANTGVNPAGLAITPDGKYLYVANNNNYSLEGQDSVTVVDLKKNLPIKTIKHSSFNEPYTITISCDGTKAYVTNSGGSTVSVVDTKRNKVVKVIDGFDGPSGFAIHNGYGYVNNYGATPGVGSGNAKTVRRVDLKTHEIVGDAIEVDLAPAAIAATSKYIYTINYTDGNPNTGTMSKIDVKDLSVSTIGPFASNGLSGPFGIDIRGKYAYVTNFGSNNFTPFGTTLSVVDLHKEEIKETYELGIQPSGVAVTNDGRYILVSNYNTLYAYITPPPVQYLNLTAGQGTVNIIDRQRKEVITTIETGQSPSYIVVSPDDKHAYVSNYTSNTVNVIKLR